MRMTYKARTTVNKAEITNKKNETSTYNIDTRDRETISTTTRRELDLLLII